MRIIDPGHIYELDVYDGDASDPPETIQFMKRVGASYPGNDEAFPGTNMQEVLRALIDRCRYVNQQTPCAETEAAGSLLSTALLLFELRAARRQACTLHIATVEHLVAAPTCATCGHVGHSHEQQNPLEPQ